MELKRILKLLVIAGAAAALLRAFVVEGIYIASASMEPALPVGAHVFLDKVTLRLREPRRGEIVVFRSPVEPDVDLVKRVIAVGGETVELRAKAVFIDGAALPEPYAAHRRAEERLEGDDLGPLAVSARTLFVLGDNRDESNDSSVWKDPKTGEPVRFVPLASVRGLVRGFYK